MAVLRPGQLLFRILILGRPGQRTRHTRPSFLTGHWALPNQKSHQISLSTLHFTSCVCCDCLTATSHIEDDHRRRPSWPITLPNLDYRPSWPKNQTHTALFSIRPLLPSS